MQYSQFKALNFSKSLILLFKFKSSLQTSEFLNHTYTNEVDVHQCLNGENVYKLPLATKKLKIQVLGVIITKCNKRRQFLVTIAGKHIHVLYIYLD